MTPNNWLIYGTNAFAKHLASELNRLGHQPVIAGADEHDVLSLAESLDCPYQVFALDKPYALQQQLKDIEIVLDASEAEGAPFSYFVEACLKAQCHYVALQPWPNKPILFETWQQQAVAKGLVCIFASGFVPEALALWQASENPAPEYFIIDDNAAHLLPWALLSNAPKTAKGLQLTQNPNIYWQAGCKTPWLLRAAACKAWLLKRFKKPMLQVKNCKNNVLEIEAFANGKKQKTLLINTQQMQQLHIKTAIFLLESLLACKILPGVYSAFEVVDNNPEQAQEFLDFIFTDLRANTHD